MRAALLIPQTGPHAALGRSMERAAILAQAGNDDDALLVFDTGGTIEGAAAAAAQARKKRASIILGPLRSAEVPAVLGATGGTMPVVTFSNDAQLRESGAFLLGITARQSVRSILQYAASRGVRRVAVDGANDPWAAQVRAAAVAESATLGITIGQLPADMGQGMANNFAGSEDGFPDAVLMASAPAITALGPQLAAQRIQPLAALPELDLTPDMVGQMEGTWLAAPDPTGFQNFVRAFEQRMGTRPGLIAALAFDASNIVNAMRLTGGLDRSALLSANGFAGVCGNVRFRENGSAARELVILELVNRAIRKVAG
ncbi:MAG: penicillin-binding protein activator [Pontixanthobacter sp.]